MTACTFLPVFGVAAPSKRANEYRFVVFYGEPGSLGERQRLHGILVTDGG